MLPIVLPETEVEELMENAEEIDGYQLKIDLEKQEISDDAGFQTNFKVEEFRRYCLLNGLDDIGLTLRHENAISDYEQTRPKWMNLTNF